VYCRLEEFFKEGTEVLLAIPSASVNAAMGLGKLPPIEVSLEDARVKWRRNVWEGVERMMYNSEWAMRDA